LTHPLRITEKTITEKKTENTNAHNITYMHYVILGSLDGVCHSLPIRLYTVFQKKNGHPFCFYYNFVSCDQILVFFLAVW